MTANVHGLSDKKISRLVLASLFLIVALGAILRIYKIGAESVWLDEAYTIEFARGSLAEIVQSTSKDVHPPLYYFALHYWMKPFGASEQGVRLLSALFGVISLVAIYRVASRLFDKATGLLAAGALALSRFHLEYSQEARMYSLLGLTSLLSMHFFLKLLDSRRSRYAFAGYVIVSTLMAYTHVYSLFILAAQNLYLVTLLFVARDVFKRVWKLWLVAQITLVVLFLPWVSVLMQQVSRVEQGFWIPKPATRWLFDTLVIHAGSHQLAWVLIPLVALGVFLGWKKREEKIVAESPAASDAHSERLLLERRLKIYFLLLWLMCPIVLPFLVSQLTTPIFLPKYTLTALPAFLILAARGLLSLRFHQLRMLVVLLLVCFSFVMLRNYYGAVKKDMWRVAASTLESRARPRDLVLFNDRTGQVPFDYYRTRRDLVEKPFPDYNSELRGDNVAELLKSAVEEHDRVWLVVSHESALTPLIPLQLAERFKLVEHHPIPGVEMYLFERRK